MAILYLYDFGYKFITIFNVAYSTLISLQIVYFKNKCYFVLFLY